jgi:hypothetical protein
LFGLWIIDPEICVCDFGFRVTSLSLAIGQALQKTGCLVFFYEEDKSSLPELLGMKPSCSKLSTFKIMTQ